MVPIWLSHSKCFGDLIYMRASQPKINSSTWECGYLLIPEHKHVLLFSSPFLWIICIDISSNNRSQLWCHVHSMHVGIELKWLCRHRKSGNLSTSMSNHSRYMAYNSTSIIIRAGLSFTYNIRFAWENENDVHIHWFAHASTHICCAADTSRRISLSSWCHNHQSANIFPRTCKHNLPHTILW